MSAHRTANPRLITINKEIMSGQPVFSGTRVPVQNLFDYLAHGRTVDDFLRGHPRVSCAQVHALLARLGELVRTAKL